LLCERSRVIALLTLSVLIAFATVTLIGLGIRDGWLRWRPGHADGRFTGLPSRPTARFNHAGIAELAKFASVRRRIGYEEGNEIIRILSHRLISQGRYQLGRAGRTSIEFLYQAADAADARAMMRDLQAVLEQPVTTAKLTYAAQVVIGSNFIAGNVLTDELFDISTFAVEEAASRPDRISFADPACRALASSTELYVDFAKALREKALELHYMPKLRLADETVFGAEALSRWNHPRHGAVPPTTFVALAEETGLIAELTLWSLDRAIKDQQRLLDAGFALDIDVNFSGQLVSDAAFCERVRERIATAPGRIGLEITETAVIENPGAALANLRRLAEAGIHIAIDDFGSGLSSLAYLRELPAHELKIDQSFVRKLTTNNRDPLLVRSAIEIAHALDMEVTAEGVEDGLALGLLKVMRCTNVQGYHISAPLPLDLLVEYLRVNASPSDVDVERLRNRLHGLAASA
jgi:EAL domain-containing protein (putative c-di-GMP-specific phosphodiesterase class I)